MVQVHNCFGGLNQMCSSFWWGTWTGTCWGSCFSAQHIPQMDEAPHNGCRRQLVLLELFKYTNFCYFLSFFFFLFFFFPCLYQSISQPSEPKQRSGNVFQMPWLKIKRVVEGLLPLKWCSIRAPESSIILNQSCDHDSNQSLARPWFWHWKLLTNQKGSGAKPV